MAKRGIEAYSLEPNADRKMVQIQGARAQGVTICSGSAEEIPFSDRTFDAAVAMWILHYVDDLDKSLREIARVVDPSSPDSRIVIVQGAPDNELVNLLNDVCAPLSAQNTAIDHQGYLLNAAAKVFAEYGFGDVEVFRVNAYCAFPEEDLTERCQKAAEVLAGFWFRDDSNFVQMKEALIPHLKLHFRDRPYAINDEVAVLVAKPLPN
jgi:SAM-dependent methyltransferase